MSKPEDNIPKLTLQCGYCNCWDASQFRTMAYQICTNDGK